MNKGIPIDRVTKAGSGEYVSRRQARVAAMQMLYATLFETGEIANSMQKRLSFSSIVKNSAMNDNYVLDIVKTFDKQRAEIEEIINAALSIPMEQLSMTELAILYLAVAELLSHPLTAPNIIIDESIELAKEYGTDGGYKIVNGTLSEIIDSLKNKEPFLGS